MYKVIVLIHDKIVKNYIEYNPISILTPNTAGT